MIGTSLDLPSPRRREVARRTGELGSLAGVRLVTLEDGPGRGVRVLEFHNAAGLRFDVLVDRAFDIGGAWYRGRSFGWQGSPGIRHPAFHENADEAGLGWLRSFSGLLLTGGLDQTLFGEEVGAEQYAYPPRPTVASGLHGRVANLPASLIGYGVDWLDDDAAVLWAEGEVRQTAIFAEHLRRWRRIEVDLDGSQIRIDDRVWNAGFDRTPHMYLYHVNFGWPLVDEGARIAAPIARTRWCTDAVWEQAAPYDVVAGPGAGFMEQVYEHVPVPASDGSLTAGIFNDRIDLAAVLSWNASAFPCLLEWMYLREGNYAVGLEPSSHHVEGPQAARDEGSLIWLEHGESRSYHLSLSLYQGPARTAAEQSIRAQHSQPDGPLPTGVPGHS
jgi:hypothetical protein